MCKVGFRTELFVGALFVKDAIELVEKVGNEEAQITQMGRGRGGEGREGRHFSESFTAVMVSRFILTPFPTDLQRVTRFDKRLRLVLPGSSRRRPQPPPPLHNATVNRLMRSARGGGPALTHTASVKRLTRSVIRDARLEPSQSVWGELVNLFSGYI